MNTETASPLESTLEKQIDSTSKLIRQVDIALSLLVVISLLLGGFFFAILADHWLLKEGLSLSMRFGIFFLLLTAAGLYTHRKIVPLFQYQVNPIYTADQIERSAPSFKNSLINWLLLRQERSEKTDNSNPNDKIAERMFDGIVRTAAVNAQSVSAEHAVDLRKLIWSGTLFAVLLCAFIGYAALSPKSPLASFARILLPFSNIERPQAIQFQNVKPGNTEALQGETLSISAEVIGRSTEPVYLVFSTDDGQAVEQRIPMTKPEGKSAFETNFPPGKQGSDRGFFSSIDYWIAQGESKSKKYRIDVKPAASIEIVSLQYRFPDYTGLPPETVEQRGDVRALEGTEVAVTVRSTLPLQKIDLVFDENPSNHAAMKTNEEKTGARGTFTLKTSMPKTFAFQATDTNGNASRRSGIYRIEVLPDQPPMVQWADTASELKDMAQIDLPLNETMTLPIQAEDPDFALRFLRFKVESGNKRIPPVKLLESPTSGPTEHRGQIKRTVKFSPLESRLAEGDSADIWVEAADTKLPEANVSSTRKITVKVTAPKKEEQKQEQQKENERQNEEQKPPPNDADKNDSKKDEQKEEDQKKDEQKNEEQNNQKEQNKEDQGKPEESQNQKGEQGQGQQGEQQPEDSKSGNAGDEHSDQKGTQSGEGNANGQNESGEKSNQQSGDQQGGNGNSGDPSQGERKKSDAEVNPETQDGDAMEEIANHIKEQKQSNEDKESKRNEKGGEQQTPEKAKPKEQPNDPNNGEKRQRDDSLDPNSQNQRKEGSDPNKPKESTNSPEKNPLGLSEKPNDMQTDRPTEQSPEKKSGKENSAEEGESSAGSEQSGNGEESVQEGSGSESQDGQVKTGQGELGQGKKGEQGSQGQGQQRQGSQSEQGQGGKSGKSDSSDGQSSEADQQEGADPKPNGGGGNEDKSEVETETEDPNLEYAQKTTNLVLEYLEDQLRNKPDEDLLKRLGWTEDQLRRFYEKWKKMEAEGGRPQSKEEGKDVWMEALKSLGLRPNRQREVLQKNQTAVKDKGRITETLRYEPPAAVKEKFKKYTEGIGK